MKRAVGLALGVQCCTPPPPYKPAGVSTSSHTREEEAGRSGVKGHPRLHSKFGNSLGYMRPYFKKKEEEERGRKGEGRQKAMVASASRPEQGWMGRLRSGTSSQWIKGSQSRSPDNAPEGAMALD